MKKVDPYLCSAAYVIRCKPAGNKARGSIVERSETADNYRAEFLGAMCILLIIKAAATDHTQTGRCRVYCDNKGVVIHCNNPRIKLKESQSQSDLVHMCQQLIHDTSINIDYQHVFCHMDNILNWNKLSLPESLIANYQVTYYLPELGKW